MDDMHSLQGMTGEIAITRVGFFSAGTAIRIVNGSAHPVTLRNATRNGSSTGHLSLFRFADNGTAENLDSFGIADIYQ